MQFKICIIFQNFFNLFYMNARQLSIDRYIEKCTNLYLSVKCTNFSKNKYRYRQKILQMESLSRTISQDVRTLLNLLKRDYIFM